MELENLTTTIENADKFWAKETFENINYEELYETLLCKKFLRVVPNKENLKNNVTQETIQIFKLYLKQLNACFVSINTFFNITLSSNKNKNHNLTLLDGL